MLWVSLNTHNYIIITKYRVKHKYIIELLAAPKVGPGGLGILPGTL